jgi:hypothetical protein
VTSHIKSRPAAFCGKLDYSDVDPTSMMVGTRSEVTKTWWCHLACFETRLPDLPPPSSVYNIEEDDSGTISTSAIHP